MNKRESFSGPQRFSIRGAAIGDINGILDCLRCAFEPYRDAYTPGAFDDTISTFDAMRGRLETMLVFVATDDNGEIIGTVGCKFINLNEGHIRGMAVRPIWQGCGLADQLMKVVESTARVKKCSLLTLNTTKPLSRAISFYEKWGFRKTGKGSNFYGMEAMEYAKELEF